jgi:predicted transcriptional regulator
LHERSANNKLYINLHQQYVITTKVWRRAELNEPLLTRRRSVGREEQKEALLTRRGGVWNEEQNETLLASQIDVSEMLRLVICSDLRKNLILSLKKGTTTLPDLRKKTRTNSTAVIHALRELEKEHLTYQDTKRNYGLTNTGEIIALQLQSLVKTASAITQFGKFWLGHDLSGIPEDSLKNIGCLQESQVLTSTATDVFNAFWTFVTLIEDAKAIRGVAPVFTPDLFDAYAELAAKGIPIELVVTHEVLENMLELADRSPLKNSLNGNLKLFVIEQSPETAFTVTDYFVMVGLFRLDGSYDYSDQLLSYSKEGIRWGSKLFDHYARASKEFHFE